MIKPPMVPTSVCVNLSERTCEIGFDEEFECRQFADIMRKISEGVRMRKKKGSSWQGRVCGFYATDFTPYGLNIESEREEYAVQIYPISALEEVTE